jgi:hypothetical protein
VTGIVVDQGPKTWVRLMVGVGAGMAQQSQTGQNGYLTTDAAVDVLIPKGWRVSVGFRDTFYRRSYLSRNPPMDAPGPLATTEVREQLLDTRLEIAFNPLHAVSERVGLDLILVPRFVYFYSAPYRAFALPIGVGLQIEGNPIGPLRLHAGGIHGASATKSETTLSALGLPLQVVDFHAGFALEFEGKAHWSVGLKWLAHWHWLEHDTRGYNGALVNVGITL